MAPDIMLKKKIFSRRSRKPPNPCPIHTQRHHSPRENGLDLRHMLWHRTCERIFFTTRKYAHVEVRSRLPTRSFPRPELQTELSARPLHKNYPELSQGKCRKQKNQQCKRALNYNFSRGRVHSTYINECLAFFDCI
jgi:hypothetical protein